MITYNLTYEQIVNSLLAAAEGLIYSGDTLWNMLYVDFGFNYEVGLNDNVKGANWKYPAFFLTPTDTTIGENSIVTYTFTITLIDQPADSLADRTAIYSKFVDWSIAFLQQLDREIKIEYNSTLTPFDVNYDAELVGWQFDISVESSLDCMLLSGSTYSGATGVPGGYLFSGTSGINGVDGADGTSGTSGVDGAGVGNLSLTGLTDVSFSGLITNDIISFDGSTWVNRTGVTGSDGSSGTSGTSGSSGVDGVDGTSGSSGVDGTSGTSGSSGVDGTSGSSGVDGNSGTSGTSGSSGVDGNSGTSGTSGSSGVDGTSGSSGIDGDSGTSGTSGSSGTDGVDGTSGSSGVDGDSGTSGSSGVDGTSGTSGSSGVDGNSGTSGTSGSSGVDGNSGTSGTSGSSGVDGDSGTSGTSGSSGIDGTSGTDGTSVTGVTDSNFWYDDNTKILHTPKLDITFTGTTNAFRMYDVYDNTAYNIYISGGTWTINTV